MTNLDWDEIRSTLAGFATCQTARERLLATRELAGEAEARASFAEIEEALGVLNLGVRPFMESLDLFSTWHQRLAKNATLRTLELRDVRHFCLETLALSEVLAPHGGPWATAVAAALMDTGGPLSAIDQIMTAEGEIRTDASEALHGLFNEKARVVRQTQGALDKLIRQHEMEPVLQDRYVTNREGRWVLPVKSGRQHALDGIIHASSQSKQTVFMEPKEIVPLNNRLRQVEVEIEDEIGRLLADLSGYLRGRAEDFAAAQAELLAADVRFAQARLGLQVRGVAVEFGDGDVFLPELRHPRLSLAAADVVPNTVELGPKRRILLLSGPNAGGKTVLLKAVGLAAHMARCGLLVAVGPGARLPFFEHLFVAVGDAQSVDQHLSTFAAHLKVLDGATRAHGPRALLLIDEIAGSTDPEEGSALARAFIRAYARQGSFAVITSHLGPLKSGWDDDSGVINGSLEYNSKTGQPTYAFLMGVPGQSLAIQTARRVGVDPRIVDEAVRLLSPEARRYHQGLEEMEKIKDELHGLRESARAELAASRAERDRYGELRQALEREKDREIDRAVRQAERKIEELIDHSKVDDVFRRHERLQSIKQDLPEIVRARPAPARPVTRVETAADFAKHFPPGSKVFAPSVGRDAVVQGVPNGKGEVAVLSASMRLMVAWNQLQPAQNAPNPTVEIVRRAGEVASPLDQDRVVDLRGQSLEDALGALDDQLDTAALNQEARVKVVHGHGTDALKKGIRNYLSRSAYVKKWKAGTPESGGDGVTWAELAD